MLYITRSFSVPTHEIVSNLTIEDLKVLVYEAQKRLNLNAAYKAQIMAEPLTDAEKAMADAKNKIGAVKAVRERLGLGLKEAVDKVRDYMGDKW